MHRLFFALAVVGVLFPGASEAQTTRRGVFGLEFGPYSFHDETNGNYALGVLFGRESGSRVIGLLLTQGLADAETDDGFTAVEAVFQWSLPEDAGLQAILGFGFGGMYEGTISVPLHMRLGVGWRVSERASLRLMGRVGSHFAFDPWGTYGGPDILTLGVVLHPPQG